MASRAPLLRHPVSVAGVIVTTLGAVGFVAMLVAAALGLFENPYAGLVVFVALPALFVLGLLLIPLGIWLQRRAERRNPDTPTDCEKVDTGGYRLEDVQLVRTDGAVVRPLTIESPPPGTGSSVGLGIGTGRTSYGRGTAIGVGTGIGMEVPVGTGNRVQGNTVLYFGLDQTGPPPWRLNVKVAQTNPATIVLPPR